MPPSPVPGRSRWEPALGSQETQQRHRLHCSTLSHATAVPSPWEGPDPISFGAPTLQDPNSLTLGSAQDLGTFPQVADFGVKSRFGALSPMESWAAGIRGTSLEPPVSLRQELGQTGAHLQHAHLPCPCHVSRSCVLSPALSLALPPFHPLPGDVLSKTSKAQQHKKPKSSPVLHILHPPVAPHAGHICPVCSCSPLMSPVPGGASHAGYQEEAV